MKKSYVSLLIVMTIILSGISGFGGAWLANKLNASPALDMAVIEPEYNEFNTNTPLSITGTFEYEKDLFLAGIDDAVTLPIAEDNSKKSTTPLTIPEIAALAANSVVEVFTETVVTNGRMGQYVSEGAGSGVITTTDGYIITCNHVIDGANKITVRLKNGKTYNAALIGGDSKTDLAVLKIKATGLQPAIYGDSDKLIVGELAVAIGNPLGELGGTVTEGIISALSRNIDIDSEKMNLLQTSAAVNPGNSGGGLFNDAGELIGIVNAKSSGTDIEGIGFAIPAKTAKAIVDDLIKYGYVLGRIDFGATLIDITDARTAMIYRLPALGVYVSSVGLDSTLKSSDRIISIGGTEIKSVADVKAILEKHKVGDTLSVIVERNNSNITVNVKLKQAKS